MKALIFDLDGTLIDTVYAHVLAWQKSFAVLEHMAVSAWRLHQKIGLDGKLLAIATGAESRQEDWPQKSPATRPQTQRNNEGNSTAYGRFTRWG